MTALTELDRRAEVQVAISEFLTFLREAGVKFYAEKFPTLAPPVYELDGGRKYLRITSDRHVHCFVDALTGDVYKAAGWKAPAKDARYNLLDPDSLAKLHAKWDPYGSYLYKFAA